MLFMMQYSVHISQSSITTYGLSVCGGNCGTPPGGMPASRACASMNGFIIGLRPNPIPAICAIFAAIPGGRCMPGAIPSPGGKPVRDGCGPFGSASFAANVRMYYVGIKIALEQTLC